jgi:hypothetical protein
VIGVLKKPVPVLGTRNTGSKIRDFGMLLYKYKSGSSPLFSQKKRHGKNGKKMRQNGKLKKIYIMFFFSKTAATAKKTANGDNPDINVTFWNRYR